MKRCMFTGMFRRRSFDEAIRLAAEIGYEAVEIRMAAPHFTQDMDRAAYRARGADIAARGLEVAGLYSFVGNFSTCSDAEAREGVEKCEQLIEQAVWLGARMVKIGTGGPNAFLAEAYHFEKSAFYLRRCADLAASAGVRIALEIHNESLIEDLGHALKLHAMIGRDNVGFIHDAGNMFITGEDFGAESVRRLGVALFHVHVKDVARESDAALPDTFRNRTKRGDELFRLVPLGQGGADHRPLFAALRANGYRGYVSTEANLTMDDIEMTRHEYGELVKLTEA